MCSERQSLAPIISRPVQLRALVDANFFVAIFFALLYSLRYGILENGFRRHQQQHSILSRQLAQCYVRIRHGSLRLQGAGH